MKYTHVVQHELTPPKGRGTTDDPLRGGHAGVNKKRHRHRYALSLSLLISGLMARCVPGKLNSQQGFTLLELLIVIVIFAIMTGTGVAKFRDFQFDTRVENVAYDVALLLRQAEVMGVSGFQTTDILLGDFEESNPVGIYIEWDSISESYVTDLVLYRDVTGAAYMYDAIPLNEDLLLDIATLQHGIVIDEIGSIDPLDPTNPNSYSNVDISISFIRPAPDPNIYTRDLGGQTAEVFDPLYIKLTDRENNDRSQYVWIERTGQIHVTRDL
ncbi:MAG: prepilin-type N-terminal cleavage/methylation domain-containing protein [Planctomycetota bacterium]|jgi:prepilin-type N-terminal cleavage/methylation domain-containing protein